MDRRLSLALTLCAALLLPTQTAAQPPLVWADFKGDPQGASHPRVQSIALSERLGDVRAEAIVVSDGEVRVSGRISKANGSQWATLGVEVAGAPTAVLTELKDYPSLRIRLASQEQRVLRIRLKGTDPRVLKIGCYPVMLLQVGSQAMDYVIPVSAFEPEHYCGERGASVEDTLPLLASIEVTANEASEDPVRFAVGRIEFLPSAERSDSRLNTLDPAWTLVWADEFNEEESQALDPTRWSLPSTALPSSAGLRVILGNSSQEVVHVGEGHAVIRSRVADPASLRCDGAPCTHATGRLQSKPEEAILYGRIEVTFKAPAVSGLGARISLVGAPSPKRPSHDTTELVIAQTLGVSPLATVGLHGPGLADNEYRAQVLLDAANAGVRGSLRTMAFEWEPTHLRWMLDDVLVKTVEVTDLPPAVRNQFEGWPHLLRIGLDVGVEGAGALPAALPSDARLLVDHVRVYQRADLAKAARSRLAAWSARQEAASQDARFKQAPRKRSAAPQEPQPPQITRQVTCERHSRLGLMMCY